METTVSHGYTVSLHSANGQCSHGQQLCLCSCYAEPKQKVLSSHPAIKLKQNSNLTIKQIRRFKRQLERIKHLFTYRYICKQFLSIKRTLQINMKHHTFIILVIQNTFLSQPHCTTLDNRNLEKKKIDRSNASDSLWFTGFTVWRFANTYTLSKDSTIPATRDKWSDQM